MTSKSGEKKATEGRERERERWSVQRKMEIVLRLLRGRRSGRSEPGDQGPAADAGGMAVRFGLPLEEVLRALTIDAASLLGVDDRLGSIDEGKIANLLITTGNPVEFTSQLEALFIRGELVPWDDKFNRLLRRYRGRTGESLP